MGHVAGPLEAHGVQVYHLVRRSVLVQGKSIRQVSIDLSLDWRTVKNMASEPVPLG